MKINIVWLGCRDYTRPAIGALATTSIKNFFKYCKTDVPEISLVAFNDERGDQEGARLKIVIAPQEKNSNRLKVFIHLQGTDHLVCELKVKGMRVAKTKALIAAGPYNRKVQKF